MTTRAERIGMRAFNVSPSLSPSSFNSVSRKQPSWGFALGTDPWQGPRAHAKDEQAGPEQRIPYVYYINRVYIKCLCL